MARGRDPAGANDEENRKAGRIPWLALKRGRSLSTDGNNKSILAPVSHQVCWTGGRQLQDKTKAVFPGSALDLGLTEQPGGLVSTACFSVGWLSLCQTEGGSHPPESFSASLPLPTTPRP